MLSSGEWCAERTRFLPPLKGWVSALHLYETGRFGVSRSTEIIRSSLGRIRLKAWRTAEKNDGRL